MNARTVAMGDWGRVIRDPIDLLRLIFFIGAAVFAVTGQLGGAGNLLISGLLLIAARFLDLPRLYDLALTIAMTLTGWGEALGLYDAISFYDNIVHFLTPLFSSQVAYIALARAEVLPDPRDDTGLRMHTAIFVVTSALGIAIGAV